jgi:hypothetical protein
MGPAPYLIKPICPTFSGTAITRNPVCCLDPTDRRSEPYDVLYRGGGLAAFALKPCGQQQPFSLAAAPIDWKGRYASQTKHDEIRNL